MIVSDNAKIKFENGALVISQAYTLNGKDYDIVVLDGDLSLSKNNLNWAKEKDVIKTITRLYFECVECAMQAPIDLSGPPEYARFVYNKLGGESEAPPVQMLWLNDSQEYPYTIASESIHHKMADLSKKFSGIFLGPPKKHKKPKVPTESHTTPSEPSKDPFPASEASASGAPPPGGSGGASKPSTKAEGGGVELPQSGTAPSPAQQDSFWTKVFLKTLANRFRSGIPNIEDTTLGRLGNAVLKPQEVA